MRDFMMKREISEKKTRDFRLNGGFPKRKRVILLKCGILGDKTVDIRLNGGFPKRKRVIFA